MIGELMSYTGLFPTQIPSEYRIKDYYRLYLYQPDENPSVGFSMLIPRGWKVQKTCPARPDEGPPTQLLSIVTSPTNPGVEINVFVMHLDREVAPADMLMSQLLFQGETVLEKRTAPTHGGDDLDILSRAQSPEGGTVLRRLAVKDGKHLFIVRALAKEQDYEHFYLHFAVAVSSFNLLTPGIWPLAESLKSFSRPNPTDFVLFYPSSWQFVRDPDVTKTHLYAELVNQVKERPMGRLLITMMSRSFEPDRQRLVDTIVEQVKPVGLGEALGALQPVEPPVAFEAAWCSQDQGGEPPVEGRLIVGQRPDAWLIFLLLSPPKETIPTAWAVNKRTLDIVTHFLRTPDYPDLPAFITQRCAPQQAAD
jgi:hypothetical protein